MPSVCLTMIVRNEAPVIERCIRSVLPYVTHFAIVDTGSTDGTQDIIHRTVGTLPGKLVELPWTDFATARNQSLNLAREVGAEFALVIDADEVLQKVDPDASFGPFDDFGSLVVRLRWAGTENVWQRRQLFRLSLPWHYEDAIHERSVCDVPHVEGGLLGFEIVSHTDGHRNRDGFEEKARRDAETLRALLAERPDDPRLTYYLANSLMTAGEFDEAIDLHEQRLEMGGFGEELYTSAVNIAGLKERRGDHWTEVISAYCRAYELRPTRAEPLWAIAAIYNGANMPHMAEIFARKACGIQRPTDALVVNEDVYKWRCADELCGALVGQQRYAEAHPILKRMEAYPYLPAEVLPIVRENLAEIESILGMAPASAA